MNKKGREQISEALSLFRRGTSIIERLRDREQDSVDNYPENLQSTARFEKMEISLEYLEQAADNAAEIEDLAENLLTKISELETNLQCAAV